VLKLKTFVVLLLLQSVTWAQSYEAPALKIYTPDQSMLMPWLYGLAFLIGCLVVAFKPAKRANLQ
jgi:hypothetical protein